MKTELKKDEKVIFLSEPHWFILVSPAVVAFIGLIIGISVGGKGILISVVCLAYLAYKVRERKNNLWVVTNLRVIDEFGVFSSNSKESPLDKINNVTYSQSFWGKMWGYGNVQIQTAAEIGSTTYFAVDNPKKLRDTITQMQEEYKHHQIRKQATELASAIAGGQNNKIDVAAELEKLHNLKERGILTEAEFNTRKAKILNS